MSLLTVGAAAQDLGIQPLDLRIEQRGDGGYHLYIRAKPGVGSILLTETTVDPARQADNYAYRSPVWNAVNGDERRILDGAFLPTGNNLFFLIDSTPQPDSQFGQAFLVFIPWVVEWGYDWSRHGQTFLADGTFINLRTFAQPYADYRGAFQDNPYRIAVTQAPFERPAAATAPAPEPLLAPLPPVTPPVTAPPVTLPPVTAPPAVVPPPLEPGPDLTVYLPSTLAAFTDIAASNGGRLEHSLGPADILPALASLLDEVPGDSLDLVLCIDTTASMADDIAALVAGLPALLAERTARFRQFRVGLALYKDYFEEYIVQRQPFTADLAAFGGQLRRIRVRGGGDIPEAIYEALYDSLDNYPWLAAERLIIVMGDAPPHPLPRGRIDKAAVDALASRLGVTISLVILPH
ncbi:MAG: hypothetical protein A2087_11070 [Spirochaetes bacterium GWD1_61_31]|nr:MAG: hypothetical protein A2Y37_09980 [Spirochaetes bacterium GWB1_60_80]OHD29094.1 MAG: hypothetical protein A2004_14670 [Spirochaetes bacterium GWC1_61_12]OHD43136.1 MAG: hypothetical protein A2087_11070 [Spirochaetes bacterium GWD1_61_31]OHD44273.1 MAG: hypothetical protein A2Y35_06865 [Spirochaetes bacterium GWE1_60_18]OHD60444.1 MAG: hypothetical protein A2Y32_00660 [Spirochaetes bacterium GWF1_60_12]